MGGVDEGYIREEECIYKDERYSARDNGAVWRHPRDGKKPRPTDCQWTFGKPNDKTGYMEMTILIPIGEIIEWRICVG